MNSAFVPSTAVVPRVAAHKSVSARRAVPTMAAQNKAKLAARLAASLPAPLLAAAPALAEGTGEGLGIDSTLLYLPLVLIPAVFFVFFIQFARGQENEDFTGEYDERRN